MSLPLPHIYGLTGGVDSTAEVPLRKDDLLKKDMEVLATPFGRVAFASGRMPDWIINNFWHHWLPSINGLNLVEIW